MNRVIHKYEVPVTENFMMPGLHAGLRIALVDMPYGAEIISTNNQHERLVLWAKVNSKETSMRRSRVVMLATGAELTHEAQADLDREYRFLDTVLFSGGSFVLHVFVEK